MRSHRASPRIVVPGDEPLEVLQDLVDRLHGGVWDHSAVLFPEIHRAAGRMEPQTDIARGGDLGVDETGPGVDVEVVGRGRASAERELGETDPRRHVGGLLVEPSPGPAQLTKPSEEVGVDDRRERPRQVLEDVVMRVHEPGGDQAP